MSVTVLGPRPAKQDLGSVFMTQRREAEAALTSDVGTGDLFRFSVRKPSTVIKGITGNIL